MKLSFSLKNKEASLEADVERLVEKGLEHKAKILPKRQDTKLSRRKSERTKNLNKNNKCNGCT